MADYQPMVGLEIHVQLATASKLFCSCPTSFGDEPNTNVCPVCLGYPGSLPATNAAAVELAARLAKSLGATLAPRLVFARKSYFYPDLPRNYQITQHDQPLAQGGTLLFSVDGEPRSLRITELHLEEDPGRMLHAGDVSLIDYNRAGTPLVEIVTEPDLGSGRDAEAALLELRRVVRYLGVSSGHMEEGSLRCDANVSVSADPKVPGERVEVKNLNSARFVRLAVDYEIERQARVLEAGDVVSRETRLWNENRDITLRMRSKESLADYRYFAEPDLPLVSLDGLEAELGELPEGPEARRRRLVSELGLGFRHARLITEDRGTADFFEQCVAAAGDPQSLATWLTEDVPRELRRRALSLEDSHLRPADLVAILVMLADRKITGRVAKQVLGACIEDEHDPRALVREQGWEQLTDPFAIGQLADAVIKEFPDAVQDVRSGESRAMKYLLGQVIRASDGRADPRLGQEALEERLTVQFVDLLVFGGTISGTRDRSGQLRRGSVDVVKPLLSANPAADVRFHPVPLSDAFSEELLPGDLSRLLESAWSHLRGGGTRGLLVTHGADTIAWTAALLSWMIPRDSAPVVLTASAEPPDASAEASAALASAKDVVVSGAAGVWLSYASVLIPGWAVHLDGLDPSEAYPLRFRHWNPDVPLNVGPLVREIPAPGAAAGLETAMARTALVPLYPGLRSDMLLRLLDSGVTAVVLLLYGSGTAGLQDSPFGIRDLVLRGAERGLQIYCTSQAEGPLDMASYPGGAELLRHGAVSLGPLSPAAAWTRVVAAQLIAGPDSAPSTVADMASVDAPRAAPGQTRMGGTE